MDIKTIDRIFAETAYVRMGGSQAEADCATYLVSECEKLGLKASIESFPVEMAQIHAAKLFADGREIPCKGYLNAGSGEAEAPLYYLANADAYSLACCRGKIVLSDGYLGYWKYQDMLENGAVGFITSDGNVNFADCDIDQRELRSYVSKGRKLPGVNINAKSAVELVKSGAKTARIVLEQDEWMGESRNVVLELPGETDEIIAFTAHYDSTSLSQGAYDNMSGCIGLLAMAEYFSKNPHQHTLRFVWCGSEERGLLGAKAYVQAHEEELDRFVLNINLDMIGSIMGKFHSCITAEEKLVGYVQYFAQEAGFGMDAKQGVYSSDSTPFADRGIPAMSFARLAAGNFAPIHNRYDTKVVVSAEQMARDINFITRFADRMANAARCPVKREIPENMKEKLDIYLLRKRDKDN